MYEHSRETIRIKSVMNEMPVPQICVQECTVTGQTAPIYADNSSYPAFQTFPAHVPLSGPSNLHCHMTTIHTALAQAPPSGKPKWKVSKQSLHRYNFPPQQMQPVPSPQMFFNNYPGPAGSVIPPTPSTPYEPFYYGTQPYFPGNFPGGNVYRTQIQTPPIPSPPPPRPYLTITQFNYQPVGYSQVQSQPSTTNLVFGPPPRDRRCGPDSQCRFYQSQMTGTPYDLERPASPRILEQPKIIYPSNVVSDPNFLNESSKRNDLKSDSSASFEFTIQPEQIVSSVCDEKEQDCYQCQNQIDPTKIPDDNLTNNNIYGTPRMWTECEFVDPMRIEDDELTKFIVDGCMKAEAIAVRNQHRPCFKNIKHLCTRTRTDILKPRTTVANIHSQGIPWATKDFIFAFVRLINCWYILKGYLDDHEGSLGKIEQALIPEFKECYQRWQTINKEMIKHLINIFVNLDNGISVQNAEIFSSFNQARKILSSCSLPCEDTVNPLITNESKSCPTQLSRNQEFQDDKSRTSSPDNQQNDTNQLQNNIDSYIDDKLRSSEFDGKSVPGILRVKNMFNNSPVVNVNKPEEEIDSDKECKHHKVYMKPGSYRVPKKHTNTPVHTPRNSDNEEYCFHESINQDQVWKYALKSFRPFMRMQLKDSETNSIICDKDETIERRSNDDQTEDWVHDHFENCAEEKIEEIREPKPQSIRPKNSRRNTIISKTYRKRNDDSEKKTNKLGELTIRTIVSQKKSVSSMFFLSERSLGLSKISTVKFEKIINVLWHQKFAKFVTFEVNIENVPDFYKHINNPMFLYKVMNNLKQHKYAHPCQVVHDLRLIVRNAELYIKKRPDWLFEECLISFSKELEAQLALEFSAIDFSSITGDPTQPPRVEINIYAKTDNQPTQT